MSEPISLFIDIFGHGNYMSEKSLRKASIGDLFYGDVPSFRIYLLSPNKSTAGQHPTPWDVVNISDLALQMALGPVQSNDPTTPYCVQAAWSKDADNKFFYADFSLATGLLQSALGASSSITSTLEIKQDKGGNKTTIYQQTVTIKPRAIGPTTVVPATPDTPISKEEANGTYAKNIGDVGAVQRFVSANGLYAVDLFVDNDGVFHTEQVTI